VGRSPRDNSVIPSQTSTYPGSYPLQGNSEKTQTMTHLTGGAGPMDVDNLVELAARLLVEEVHPERIILFGSYARGDFDKGSDLDLLVILREVEDRIEEMVRLRRALKDIPMAIDVVVYSRADVEERQHLRGTMLYHALREGKVLHLAA
jgi:predicted nucleotidyltransferase